MTDPDYSKRTAPTASQTTSQPITPSQPTSFSENHTLTIGIQGGQGSFNEEAVQFFLKQNNIANSQIQYLYTSGNVMAAVQRGEIERGQCAIYNSVGGYVEETTEALKQYPVDIIEEFEIKIAHALMIRPDQDFAKIDTIMCHPQVLAQCKSNLKVKYPHFAQTSGEGEMVDNAKTAEALSKQILPDNTAVMGSKVLAEIYGLQIIEDNLQDAEQNYTRFIHVTRKP